jgi:hypothetical protein
MSTLNGYKSDDKTANAFTLSNLSELKAVEAVPLMDEMFEAG